MKTSSKFSPENGQILAVNKPVGWTSFDVVRKVRRLSNIKKVGHAGTLDPFATGVLVVCLGPATKRSAEIMSLPKRYQATIQFGFETDTMDHTGTSILEGSIPNLTRESVEQALAGFIGDIEQEIPSYSAAKFQGKRLYKLAREGQEVPTLFKHVHVAGISIVEISESTLTIDVECGRGTYIRTLGRDIARQLSSAGHLSVLTRTAVGDFVIEDAVTIEELPDRLQNRETQLS